MMFTWSQFLSCCGFLEFFEGNKRRLARDASQHLVYADWWAWECGAWAGSGQEASQQHHAAPLQLPPPAEGAAVMAGSAAALGWGLGWREHCASASPHALCFSERGVGGQPCHKLTFLSGIQMSRPPAPLGLSALDCLFQSLTWNAKSNVNTYT